MRNRAVPDMTDRDRAYVKSLLFADRGTVLAFNKPSGLAVQTRGNQGRNLDDLLWAFARSNGKRPRLVHRLDSGTSGVILAAKTHPASVFLSEQFAKRVVKKTYLAVVNNSEDLGPDGTIDISLVRTSGRPPRAIADSYGKPAQTQWRVLRRVAGFALVELKPLTGRMHQLRAHMAHIGCPLLGDPIYGGQDASRLMLHAHEIELQVEDGQLDAFSAEPGAEWLTVLEDNGLS